MSNEQASSEAQVQNDMILKQKEAIEKEIQASHQLIDVIEEVKVLETQFCNDPTFLKNAMGNNTSHFESVSGIKKTLKLKMPFKVTRRYENFNLTNCLSASFKLWIVSFAMF